MKVLYANTTLPPLHFGGSEIYCMGLAKTLPGLGVETAGVCIESWSDGDHRTQSRRIDSYQGIRIHRLYGNETWEPLSTLWTGSSFYQVEFEKILDEEKPDLIHVMAHLRLAKLIELARRRGIPVVLTGVDFSPFCSRSSLVRWDGQLCDGKAEVDKCSECIAFSRGLREDHWWGRASKAWHLVKGLSEPSRDTVYRLAAGFKRQGMGRVRFFDEWGYRTAGRVIGHLPELFDSLARVFAPSPVMRQMWEANGYPPERIIDLPYGVDLGSDETGKYKTHGETFRFAFIGRFTGLKNLATLLEAFFLIEGTARISLSLYGAEDFWAGSDPELNGLRELAKRSPNLHFKGRLDRAQISQVYEEIDCLVSPSSWYENAPISMMEAQRFKTPIICTDLPGMTCLVKHEVNGLVFRNKSARELALQMYRLATDPGLYSKLRANSLSIQTMEENAQHVLRHYLEVTGKSMSDLKPRANGRAAMNGHANSHAEPVSPERALSLSQELSFWSGEMTENRMYPWHSQRMNRAERKQQFPSYLEPFFRRALEDFGVEQLEVVELGSGPLSTLAWGVDEGLCRVTAVDPLADEYNKLLDEHKVDAPIRPIKGRGEDLADLVGRSRFHVAFCSNALDHLESPAVAFHNLVETVVPGGYICLAHFLKEGSQEGWEQLHQWDLWDADGGVFLANREGKVWRLDWGLGLEPVMMERTQLDTERPQFHVIFKKAAHLLETNIS